MNQPTITCPHCEAEITLTESLADPLIRETRKKIAEKEAEVARPKAQSERNAPNSPRRLKSIEHQFTTRLETERERIAAEEAEKARLWWATDLERKSQEVADLQREIQERDNKLAEAQKAPNRTDPKAARTRGCKTCGGSTRLKLGFRTAAQSQAGSAQSIGERGQLLPCRGARWGSWSSVLISTSQAPAFVDELKPLSRSFPACRPTSKGNERR